MLWKVWKTWTLLNGKAAISELQGLLKKPGFTLQSEEKNFELKRLWQKVQNEVYYVLCFSIIRVIQMYLSFKVRWNGFCIVQPVLVSSCIVYITVMLHSLTETLKGKSFWGCELQFWSFGYSKCCQRPRALTGVVPLILTARVIPFDDSLSGYNHRYRVEGCALKQNFQNTTLYEALISYKHNILTNITSKIIYEILLNYNISSKP